MNKKNLYFLRFGYYPGNISKIINPTNYDHKQPFDLKELIDLFKKEIADCCKDKRIRIPLSGGFDSRFLLALCIDLFSKDKIELYTFGNKNTFDFQIPITISKKLKLDHIISDQSTYDYNLDEHIKEALEYNKLTHFFHNGRGNYKFDGITLSGLAGDILFGSALNENDSTMSEEIYNYLQSKNISKFELNINDYLHFFKKVQKIGTFSNKESLVFSHRVPNYYTPLIYKNSVDNLSVFMQPSIINYFSTRERNKKKLFHFKLGLLNYIEKVLGNFPYKNFYGLNRYNYIKFQIYKNFSRIQLHKKMKNNFNFKKNTINNARKEGWLNEFNDFCEQMKISLTDSNSLKTALPLWIKLNYSV
tara:strand:- start:568 stop:1650 length:1083 start_codon:yes stop_codon:yes gene_type:complete